MALVCRQCIKQVSLLRSLYWKPFTIQTPLKVVCSPNAIAFRTYSSSIVDAKKNDETPQDPIKFSTSEASQWKAKYSRMGEKDDDSPPAQPIIVVLSVAVFLIYFLVLREENDIDIKLGGGNFNSIEAYVEYIQLKTIVKHNETSGIATDEQTLKRFKELEKLDVLNN